MGQHSGGLERGHAQEGGEDGGPVRGGPARLEAGQYGGAEDEGVGRAEEGAAQVVQGQQAGRPGDRQAHCAQEGFSKKHSQKLACKCGLFFDSHFFNNKKTRLRRCKK